MIEALGCPTSDVVDGNGFIEGVGLMPGAAAELRRGVASARKRLPRRHNGARRVPSATRLADAFSELALVI